ncbi:hypothetical protein ACQP1W_17980 [Spirillospora sp. CA-255316]
MSPSPGVPSPEALEARIAELRASVRRAMARGDRTAARTLRAELRRAEDAWDDAVLGEGPVKPAAADDSRPGAGTAAASRADADRRPASDRSAKDRPAAGRRAAAERGNGAGRGLVPVREQVHQALTLLGVPAAPKLIGSVYAAFFPGEIPGSRLTSLRRDEERSFRTAPYSRPFYLCAALTADLLAPARGLITVSTWPLEQRVVGPLSARTDFLTAALRIAEHAGRGGGPPSPAVQRLLWRFAANIPGTPGDAVGTVEPAALAEAAEAELEVHRAADGRQRREAAERALSRLDDAERLFGSRLRAMRTAAASGTDGQAGPAGQAGRSGPSGAVPGTAARASAAPARIRPAGSPGVGGALPRVPRGSAQGSRASENPRAAEEKPPAPPALRQRRAKGGGPNSRKPRRPEPPASSALRPHRATHEDDR